MSKPRQTQRRAAPASAAATETPALSADANARQRRAARAVLRDAQKHFGHVSPLDLAVFVERYPDAACLKLAAHSKAHVTLHRSARIVRQLLPTAPGAADHTQGLRAVGVALVIHFARLVDEGLIAEMPRSSLAIARVTLSRHTDDATARLASVEESLARALGKNEIWRQVYAEARPQKPQRRDLALRLEQCAAGLTALRAVSPTCARSLEMEGLDERTAPELLALADALETASMALQAPLTAGQDSRGLNLLEGRLLYALGDLLRAVRQARKESKTALVLRVAPGLLRQLRLSRTTSTAGLSEDTDGPLDP